jgi:glycosyltransferase involved in cell wall biosynthesis
MNILWITNIIFPKISKELGVSETVIGGWMYSSANQLIKSNDKLSLGVATTYSGNVLKKLKIDNITYYLLPNKKSKLLYNSELELIWKEIINDFKPDLTHLHGTEFSHGLSYLNTAKGIKSVVSIQGLTSVCAKYFYSQMTFRDIFCNLTLRNLIKNDSIFNQKKQLKKSGETEKLILGKVLNVIGRTTWDKAHTLNINPYLNYYFCNETLRESFYYEKWEYEKCEKFTIFISQAESPLKAVHQVVKAVFLLINKYPNIKVYVAGNNIINTNSFIQKVKLTGYGKYLKKLLKKLHLTDNFIFTGPLNEKDILLKYLNAHVFICPSSLENSSNSICEAQILGVPVISSFVGGTSDFWQTK